ncbi:hypothetical protein R3P38DRAFT_3170451 [Favolaschia claudopus]|uniref:Uncharacterized protein n=1 Tax=Favolaschia claudopus TaxID=2862362 RepID=A0AAW0DWC9_9AGAR
MLTSLTTSKRRRGLRGKASREKLSVPAPLPGPPSSAHSSSSFYSQGSSSRLSTSSLASTRTVSKVSRSTSMTSLSHISSPPHFNGEASQDRCEPEISLEPRLPPSARTPQTQHVYHAPPSQRNKGSSPLSPMEMLRMRFADGMLHTRRTSTASSVVASSAPITVVRVSGRGGQGSRPRALPVDLRPSRESESQVRRASSMRVPPSAPGQQQQQPIRIVGRGGLASRPRGMMSVSVDLSPSSSRSASSGNVSALPLATAPMLSVSHLSPPIPQDVPTHSTSVIPEEVSASPLPAPALYRPAGRGGAGTRYRKVKPEPSPREDNRNFKFPWMHGKGKGKAKADMGLELAAIPNIALTRTDTRDSHLSTVSSIAFVPARTRPHQKAVSPDPPTPTSLSGSFASIDSLEAQLARHESSRARMSKLSRTLGTTDFAFSDNWQAGTAKLGSKRASISVPQAQAMMLESPLKRQASYDGPVPQISTHLLDDHEHSTWGGYVDDDDDVSEILSLSPNRCDPRNSVQSISSGEIHVQPRLDFDDTDSEYASRSHTPTRFAPYGPYSRGGTPPPGHMQPCFEEDDDIHPYRSRTDTSTGLAPHAPGSHSRGGTPTPLPDDKQRFESPFQTMPLFVVPWEPAPPAGDDEDMTRHEWLGEWNQDDVQSVSRSLRTLGMSSR